MQVSNMEEVRQWKEKARSAVLREVKRRKFEDIDVYMLTELAILIGYDSWYVRYVKNFIDPDKCLYTHSEAAQLDKIFDAWDRGENIERCKLEDIEHRIVTGFVMKRMLKEMDELLKSF